MDRIRVVLETDRDLEIATATMQPSGRVVYTGEGEVIKTVVEEALKGSSDPHRAFRALKKRGWSNAYLMIELEG